MMSFRPAALGPRMGAAIIDIVIVSIGSYALSWPLFRLFHLKEREETLKSQLLQMQQDPMSMDPAMMQSLMGVAVGICLLLLALLILMHVYYVYFESTSGQTPGKKLLNLRVVTLDGQPISRNQALSREMLRWYFDGLFLLPAFIAIFSTPRRQRVGDILAKTMVIEVDPQRSA